MNNSPQNSEVQVASRRAAGSGVVDNSDDEDWSGLVECAVLERSKSDRAARADEDRRRRTIIVEKKNGTYGFTLQSYGIHYKREQEIEMVTYVDYVEYDGPAFKAGMREGDVILSINGHEMDRADHKTLVNFIKNCDARMRMVVSFEDCVRKVELHMRYIELQRALQSRLAELERLCERERSILMGRWKTHSLPARKRTPTGMAGGNPGQPSPSSSFNSSTVQCCRPATSTEHLLLYSVYADGRPCLIPRNAACLVAVGPPRSRSDHHHFLSKSSNVNETSSISSRHSYHQANGISTPAKSKSQHKSGPQQTSCSSGSNDLGIHSSAVQQHNSLCVACISSANRRRDPTDGGSLDVYDLASPCCDPNCVPSRRRREKQRRARNEQQNLQQQQQQQQQQHQHHHIQSQREQQQQQQQHQQSSHGSHNCSRASGHSLHSITSSEMSTAAESVASCSTSLSTDTLYWDPNVHQRPPACLQYAKPKSWDNLTTKAFGGYGFGYGYLDTANVKTHSAERPGKGSHGRAKTPTGSVQRRSGTTTIYASTSSSTTSSSGRHFQPNKSTESLLIAAPYNQGDLVIDGSLSCECLDGPNPRFVTVQQQLDKHSCANKRQDDGSNNYNNASGNAHQQQQQQQQGSNSAGRHRRASHSDGKLRAANNSEDGVFNRFGEWATKHPEIQANLCTGSDDGRKSGDDDGIEIMSKRKHNIAYIKPDEPKFLRELKAQAGFKEGPTIDTKREDLDEDFEDDRDDLDEEEPIVVVLKEGDLTAEEADAIKKQKEDEEANAKADLTKRVIFKKNKISETDSSNAEIPSTIKKSKKTKPKKAPLSFNDEEDE